MGRDMNIPGRCLAWAGNMTPKRHPSGSWKRSRRLAIRKHGDRMHMDTATWQGRVLRRARTHMVRESTVDAAHCHAAQQDHFLGRPVIRGVGREGGGLVQAHTFQQHSATKEQTPTHARAWRCRAVGKMGVSTPAAHLGP
jgi:hypothetical protein